MLPSLNIFLIFVLLGPAQPKNQATRTPSDKLFCYDEQLSPIFNSQLIAKKECMYVADAPAIQKSITLSNCSTKNDCFAGCVRQSCLSVSDSVDILERKRTWSLRFILFVVVTTLIMFAVVYLSMVSEFKLIEKSMLEARKKHSLDANVGKIHEESDYEDSRKATEVSVQSVESVDTVLYREGRDPTF